MNKIDELRWIRVFTPDHVPHYLIEQIRDRDYSVEEFFRFHQINCLVQGENGVVLNPFSHLYVLADKMNQVKGVLWIAIDPLSKDIIIQTFSMDKEYWGKGQAVKKLAEHIKEIRLKGKLNKIYWITNYEKHSMRYGFKRSKSILMEYDPRKEEVNGKDIDGRHQPRGECEPPKPGAAKLPERSDGGTDGTDGGECVPAVSAAI